MNYSHLKAALPAPHDIRPRQYFGDGGIVGNLIDQALPYEPFRDFITPLVQAGKRMKETIETGQNRAKASEKATQAKYGMMLMNKAKKDPNGLVMGLLKHDMASKSGPYVPTMLQNDIEKYRGSSNGGIPQNTTKTSPSVLKFLSKNGTPDQKQQILQMLNPQQQQSMPQDSPQEQPPSMGSYSQGYDPYENMPDENAQQDYANQSNYYEPYEQ